MALGELTSALGCGDNPVDLDQDRIPDIQTPMLAQAFDEALQPALQYLKYKELRLRQ